MNELNGNESGRKELEREQLSASRGLASGAFPSGFSKSVEASWLHEQLTVSRPSHVQLRYRDSITQRDIPLLKQLHNEWFPVHYDDGFFHKILSGRDRIVVVEARLLSKFYIVGCLTFRFKPSKSKFRRSNASDYFFFLSSSKRNCSVYVMTLGVVPELRGRGVARRLFEEMKQAVKPLVLDYVYLDVIDYNIPALGFYKQLGFSEFKRKKQHYHLEGVKYDGIVVIKYEREELKKREVNLKAALKKTMEVLIGKPSRVLSSFCKKRSDI